MIFLKCASLALLIPLYLLCLFAVFNGLQKRELHADWPITMAFVFGLIVTGGAAGTIASGMMG